MKVQQCPNYESKDDGPYLTSERSSYAHSPCQPTADQGACKYTSSSEAQGERRGRWFGGGGSGVATFQKAIDLLGCTERKVISVKGMSHNAEPEIKLTIPRYSGGLGSADYCEEDDDLREREELHDISREKSFVLGLWT